MALERLRTHAVMFIASEAVLAVWRERAAPGDAVVGVNDAAEPDLLALIASQRPEIVVLEERFACTERGAALIGWLRTTPEFQDIDIRVLWSERVAQIGEQGQTMPLTDVATSIRPSYPAVRRTARRTTAAVDATIDGHRVEVVDVSVGGAQVLSGVTLYADQRVHMVLAESVPIDARVVWVRLEMTPAPRYRAGLEFLDADPQTLSKLLPPS